MATKQNLLDLKQQYIAYLATLALIILTSFTAKLFLGFYLIGKYIDNGSYWVAVAQKYKTQKATSIHEKKILLVSGSNTFFDINAKKISEELKVPTVNFAIYGGLGVRYILDNAKDYLKPGDTVVIPLEYDFYYEQSDVNQVFEPYLNYVLSNDTAYFSKLDSFQKINYIIRLPVTDIVNSFVRGYTKEKYIAMLRQKSSGQRICDTGFTLDEDGDETCNIGGKPIAKIHNQFQLPDHYDIDKYHIIQNFISWCHQHQVQVIGLFPTMHYLEEFNQPNYHIFFERVREFYRSQNTPILGSPYDSMLPTQFMFNTHYHANDQGRTYRTKQVISLYRYS